MNSLYGVRINKDINDSKYCKSEQGMKTEYDEIVLEYWHLPNGRFIKLYYKDEKRDGLDDDCDFKITPPGHLLAFILSKVRHIWILLFVKYWNL